jgi:hypothetical protein
MKAASPTRRRHLFPQSLAQTLDPLLKPIYKQHGFTEHRILTQWTAIVGAELSAYSVPQKLAFGRGKESGVLHVLVAAARALEIQHLQPVILERIRTYLGTSAITAIRITQAPTTSFRKNTARAPERLPAPGNDFCAVAARCNDEQLREALLSLGALLGTVEN